MKASRFTGYGTTVLALAMLTLLPYCQDPSRSQGEDIVLLLGSLALSVEPAADIVPDTGFPGSRITVPDPVSGSLPEFAVSIDGVAATGLALNSGELSFVMPSLPSYSENVTLNLLVTRSGETVVAKTIRYRPAPALAINEPNGLQRLVSPNDTRSFFSVNLPGTGNYIFNTFGYSGHNLDIYYHTAPDSGPTPIATNAFGDAEFRRISLPAGSYIIEVRRVDGLFNTPFRLNIANGAVQPASTFNEYGSQSRCYDFAGTGDVSNSAGGCQAQNGTAGRTGRCTYPSNQGIVTRSYYITCDENFFCTGFDPEYAETTCLQPGYDSPNPDQAIFELN